MSNYRVEFPVLTSGVAEIEFDGTEDELRNAILNGRLEVDYEPNGAFYPVMNLENIYQELDNISSMLPIDLEVSED